MFFKKLNKWMHSFTEHLCAEQWTLVISVLGARDFSYFSGSGFSQKILAKKSGAGFVNTIARQSADSRIPMTRLCSLFPLNFYCILCAFLTYGGGDRKWETFLFSSLPFLLLFPLYSLPFPGLYFISREWTSEWGITLLALMGYNLFMDLSPCFPGMCLTLLEVTHCMVCRGGQSRDARCE